VYLFLFCKVVPESCFSHAKRLANEKNMSQFIVCKNGNSEKFLICSSLSSVSEFKLIATVYPDASQIPDSICGSADLHGLMIRPGLELHQQ
jgi:hypothetical protein